MYLWNAGGPGHLAAALFFLGFLGGFGRILFVVAYPARSKARHMYHDATVRYGRQRSPNANNSFGLGMCFFPYATDQPFFTPKSWIGRTSGRPRRKIRNISTDHAPIPRTETSRLTNSSSESLCASSRLGTMPAIVFFARSFIAAAFAAESPALRSAGMRSFTICSGEGARPFPPSAFTRVKIVAAAFPEIDW